MWHASNAEDILYCDISGVVDVRSSMPSNLPKGDKLCRLPTDLCDGSSPSCDSMPDFAPVTVMFALSPRMSNSSKLVAGLVEMRRLWFIIVHGRCFFESGRG